MVSIQGLPQTAPQPQKIQRNKRKKAQAAADVTQPSPVATAVSRGIRASESADGAAQQHARLHYDGPDSKNRQALSSYHDVLNQRRREELSEMFGVDIYV